MVCIYISLSFEIPLILKEIELLLNDVSNIMSSAVFIIGDKNNDLPKQDNVSSIFSISLQCNGMTYLLTTALRSIIDSATLIDHVFHNQFSHNPDCGLLDAGLTDHSAFFVKVPLFCTKNDDTGTMCKNFSFLYKENAWQVYVELLSSKLEKPSLHHDPESKLKSF